MEPKVDLDTLLGENQKEQMLRYTRAHPEVMLNNNNTQIRNLIKNDVVPWLTEMSKKGKDMAPTQKLSLTFNTKEEANAYLSGSEFANLADDTTFEATSNE